MLGVGFGAFRGHRGENDWGDFVLDNGDVAAAWWEAVGEFRREELGRISDLTERTRGSLLVF